MPKCKSKTKAGKPCRAAAGPDGVCFLHADPKRAKELGQIGGRGNRKSTGLDLQIPDNLTAADLCKFITEAIRALLAGQLQPREAAALVQLCNLHQRVTPTAELESRISKLERDYTQRENKCQSEQNSIDPLSAETAVSGTNTEEALELLSLSSGDAGGTGKAQTSDDDIETPATQVVPPSDKKTDTPSTGAELRDSSSDDARSGEASPSEDKRERPLTEAALVGSSPGDAGAREAPPPIGEPQNTVAKPQLMGWFHTRSRPGPRW